MDVDRLEHAWAAGFFDGEGSTIARTFKRRPGYRQLAISVPQTGDRSVPEVLARFKRAMFDIGTISGPNGDGIYAWRAFGREHVHLALSLLWPYVGDAKRAQATAAMNLVNAQYASGAYVRRVSRSVAPSLRFSDTAPEAADLEAAWAAGFLDAEGCFGLNHVGPRVNGPDWYRIRCSASQHGEVRSQPEVLQRIQALLGGRIERHGENDDYKWLVEGATRVEAALNIVGAWLGTEKREQSARALSAFKSQIRLKGDATNCLRGHRYSGSMIKGGRIRKVCDACKQLYDARERDRRRIAFLRFEEPKLPYTA